jgi:hypothetical protein
LDYGLLPGSTADIIVDTEYTEQVIGTSMTGEKILLDPWIAPKTSIVYHHGLSCCGRKRKSSKEAIEEGWRFSGLRIHPFGFKIVLEARNPSPWRGAGSSVWKAVLGLGKPLQAPERCFGSRNEVVGGSLKIR